ncbi:MAG: transporter [Flavobacteriales bacterium]|nr:transporter [Flavobacteriia bacterium]NCP05889.1 transporter [Flavobacteriales bacterium]PIV94888.1 MAG: transporter [Flavobacteriaceae bacterium CG17_big_fil_post_rev_8_21_14_2_50_33_15]PIY09944.1 MAG: transporter [Flavobacteriaceae bacterium CG_4_10_14_3_um_filter_33_47]PJB19548.1 MAG: transporter [Flavobacteriaceae bacterium CG_4_9_14_3_um_filter_33_16]
MKKLTFLFMSVLTMSFVYGQDITDALRYSQDDIQGSARFRALSGAFGALGGDLSAVSLNPAGSAVFTRSYASFSISNLDTKNDSRYFNGFNTTTENKFDINQGGAVFVFANNNSNSPWKKFTISMEYDKTRNFDDQWSAVGTNTNNNSIDLYFLNYADGLRLDEISALPGESISDAYSEIGNFFGFGHQQAFLGFESFILEPDSNDDANTTYFSNLANGTFNQQYTYASTGYNGKITFNAAVQYEDNLYLGINLNSHLINYDRTTLLFESNSNVGSIINDIDFENTLSTIGTGFSFQLGGILKLSNEFRVGLTFDSPVWYSIEEETTQFLSTNGTNGAVVVNPQVVNVFPRYRLQTPAKATGSLAYVFGDQGLISFDYSVKDYSKTKFRPKSDPAFIDQNNIIGSQLTTASTYRIGGEYKYKQFSFRGGYRFEESPYKNEVTVGDLNGYSLGIGFNFGNTKLDLTFDEANRTNKNALYQVGLTDAATVDTKNTNVTLTLGFNL